MEIILVLTVLLFIAGIVASFLGGKVEVDPGTSLLFKNTRTGNTRAKMKGIHFLSPQEKEIRKISHRNEITDPAKINVNTADPISIGVDFVFTIFRVAENEEAIGKAFTEIDYDKRLASTILRTDVFFQDVIGRLSFVQIYNNGSTDRDIVTKIEQEINNKLKILEKEWGLVVQIEIRNIIVPQAIIDANEEKIKAEHEGQAIKAKADAIGGAPNARELIIADAVGDVARIVIDTLTKGK